MSDCKKLCHFVPRMLRGIGVALIICVVAGSLLSCNSEQGYSNSAHTRTVILAQDSVVDEIRSELVGADGFRVEIEVSYAYASGTESANEGGAPARQAQLGKMIVLSTRQGSLVVSLRKGEYLVPNESTGWVVILNVSTSQVNLGKRHVVLFEQVGSVE